MEDRSIFRWLSTYFRLDVDLIDEDLGMYKYITTDG